MTLAALGCLKSWGPYFSRADSRGQVRLNSGIETELQLLEVFLLKLHRGKLRHPPEWDDGTGERTPGSLKKPFVFRAPIRVQKALSHIQLHPKFRRQTQYGKLQDMAVSVRLFWGLC